MKMVVYMQTIFLVLWGKNLVQFLLQSLGKIQTCPFQGEIHSVHRFTEMFAFFVHDSYVIPQIEDINFDSHSFHDVV